MGALRCSVCRCNCNIPYSRGKTIWQEKARRFQQRDFMSLCYVASFTIVLIQLFAFHRSHLWGKKRTFFWHPAFAVTIKDGPKGGSLVAGYWRYRQQRSYFCAPQVSVEVQILTSFSCRENNGLSAVQEDAYSVPNGRKKNRQWWQWLDANLPRTWHGLRAKLPNPLGWSALGQMNQHGSTKRSGVMNDCCPHAGSYRKLVPHILAGAQIVSP